MQIVVHKNRPKKKTSIVFHMIVSIANWYFIITSIFKLNEKKYRLNNVDDDDNNGKDTELKQEAKKRQH